jgi:hypothetical protein
MSVTLASELVCLDSREATYSPVGCIRKGDQPVARRTIVETFDDIDGTPVEDGGESISFAVDGVEYTIDLNKKNARDFRKKLDYYIEHATRVGGRKKRAGTARASDVNSPNPKEIREWAIEEGFEVPARGRLPQSLVDEYVAAH